MWLIGLTSGALQRVVKSNILLLESCLSEGIKLEGEKIKQTNFESSIKDSVRERESLDIQYTQARRVVW